MNTTKKPNRLIHEKSPYLLQHAYNPVDWYPWGEEAFKKAHDEDKPIFLSVGYSTCYWCHVMEREVFENETIAGLMNEKLVNIKVDREEQPDIDRVYMSAVQAIAGQGGWPMSVFLTPDLKPFYAGTYFPPTSRHGRPGFPDVVNSISDSWRKERDKILSSSEQITTYLQKVMEGYNTATPDESIFARSYQQFLESYDAKFGGFGSGAKFPRPSTLNFLLRYFQRTGNGSSLKITLNTLRAMARGGIYDHLGGGFHRYSVDDQWRVPHFEKMLYDQAQLAIAYLEVYQLTKNDEFIDVAKGILDYVLIKLHHKKGGFYSAEDAESIVDRSKPGVKEEGAFYLWTKTEIETFFGKENAKIFNYYFGVEDEDNTLQDPMNILGRRNVLYIAHGIEETAKKFSKNPAEIQKLLIAARHQLYLGREKRMHPNLDDKIITAWNGLMISAFAKAYQLLGYEVYLNAAESAAKFVMAKLYDLHTQMLNRRYRDGEARFAGGLQDYAFLIMGLIDLYETSFDIQWFEYAITLTKKQIEIFWDNESGGFFETQKKDSTLLLQLKEDYDGAEPTGNSIAALNLLRLALMTNNDEWRKMAEKTIHSFGDRMNRTPEALPQMLVALDWHLSKPKEIIIVGDRSSEDAKNMLREVYKHILNKRIVLFVDDNSGQRLISYLPFIQNLTMIGGKTTAYICENYSCKLPTTNPSEITELFENGVLK